MKYKSGCGEMEERGCGFFDKLKLSLLLVYWN